MRDWTTEIANYGRSFENVRKQAQARLDHLLEQRAALSKMHEIGGLTGNSESSAPGFDYNIEQAQTDVAKATRRAAICAIGYLPYTQEDMGDPDYLFMIQSDVAQAQSDGRCLYEWSVADLDTNN
jgi:hypothetical protein